MWTILIALALGFLIGRLEWIPEKYRPLTHWITTGGLVILLISMGAGISSNPNLLTKISQLGFQALFLALFATAGSVLLVWLIEIRIFSKSKGDDE